MKKLTVYILALLLLTTVLAGCGSDKNTATPSPNLTVAPTLAPSAVPSDVMPDPEDGTVTDDDGIIGDSDDNTANTPLVPGDGEGNATGSPNPGDSGGTGSDSTSGGTGSYSTSGP